MNAPRINGRLFIARHGETVFNAAARMQGDVAHTPLTRAGFAQADEMGAALRRSISATAAFDPVVVAGGAGAPDSGRDRRASRARLARDAGRCAAGGDRHRAIRAYNGLRRHLPLLQALAANSPFRDDRDAGVQSARVLAMRAWVRTGVPRALRDYDEWLKMSERLVRATALPDYTFFWWRIRPHPRLGTVEVRTMDTQASLEDTAALAALVHALARQAAEAPEAAAPPEELLDEAMYRAARYGVDGAARRRR